MSTCLTSIKMEMIYEKRHIVHQLLKNIDYLPVKGLDAIQSVPIIKVKI